MEETWKGRVTHWDDRDGRGCSGPSSDFEGGQWLRIEFPLGLNLSGAVGSIVEVRLKEPSPHLCGEYRVECEPAGWVARLGEPWQRIIMRVKFCPNCGKKLE